MNKTYILPVIALMVIFTLGFASAIEICGSAETTYVSGIISQEGSPVDGADVQVSCNGNLKSTTSAADGSYNVEYTAEECDFGDSVTVSASKDSLTGSSDDAVDYTENFTLGCFQLIINVACTDVTLVPEFGLIAGALTIMGAVGLMFLVRRK